MARPRPGTQRGAEASPRAARQPRLKGAAYADAFMISSATLRGTGS
jgi:hypothetical protein